MFKTILWATDGSATADRALPYAKALAASEGAKLLVIHCKEIIVGGRGSGYPVLADEEDIVAKINGQVEELKAGGVNAALEVISGVASGAAHAIADVAHDQHADLIVVGTRGHAPVAGLLVGSVTQRLLHVAPCPVLAVPGGKHAEPSEHALETTAASH
jgi:nucleotide-binding universal stress UspA family protein